MADGPEKKQEEHRQDRQRPADPAMNGGAKGTAKHSTNRDAQSLSGTLAQFVFLMQIVAHQQHALDLERMTLDPRNRPNTAPPSPDTDVHVTRVSYGAPVSDTKETASPSAAAPKTSPARAPDMPRMPEGGSAASASDSVREVQPLSGDDMLAILHSHIAYRQAQAHQLHRMIMGGKNQPDAAKPQPRSGVHRPESLRKPTTMDI